jgi:hypothetical protein
MNYEYMYIYVHSMTIAIAHEAELYSSFQKRLIVQNTDKPHVG